MKLILFFMSLFLMQGISVQGQTPSAYNPKVVEKAKKDAAEVYKNCIEYAGDQYIPTYAEFLSRVSIEARQASKEEDYALLSTVALKNKCNQELERETAKTFNPETFNPLKYFFEYYSGKDKTYRVDGTNYIIVIHKKAD